jgi:hypothetical protein
MTTEILMSELSKVLDRIGSESVQDTKNQFQQLLVEAKASTDPFVKDNAEKVESWVVMLSNETIDKDEFDDLMSDQQMSAEQFVNTQAISAQAGGKRLTLQLMDLAVTKIVPALLAARLT